jgi:predicted MFS family arabinose efflux permease
MAADLGLTRSQVFGAFACSQVVAGVLAPWSGRAVDRVGGRRVLVASAVVGALGFVVLAQSKSAWSLFAGWITQGVAMSLGLYDTCFAAIARTGQTSSYRRTVTGVTLIAGFASTVSWPATHYLLEYVGWRNTCGLYAGAMLLCVPVYATVLPATPQAKVDDASARAKKAASLDRDLRRRARLLALAFAGTALISASLSAHVVELLSTLRVPQEQAVWIGASIGCMQVAGRLMETWLGARHSAMQLGHVTFAGFVVAAIALGAAYALPQAVYAFAVVYGISNGLITIAKATVPVHLFGFSNVGAVLGKFSAPSLVARAVAPFGFAIVAASAGTPGALAVLVAVALAAQGAYALAARDR